MILSMEKPAYEIHMQVTEHSIVLFVPTMPWVPRMKLIAHCQTTTRQGACRHGVPTPTLQPRTGSLLHVKTCSGARQQHNAERMVV